MVQSKFFPLKIAIFRPQSLKKIPAGFLIIRWIIKCHLFVTTSPHLTSSSCQGSDVNNGCPICNLRSCYCICIVHTNVAGFLYGYYLVKFQIDFFRQICRPQSTWQRYYVKRPCIFHRKIVSLRSKVLSIKRYKYTKTRKNFDFPPRFS